jgi:hypothetical protein
LDFLSIAPPLFSRVLFSLHFSEKSSKIKFLEKFQKNLLNFLCQKWGREAPGRPQGDPLMRRGVDGFSPSSWEPQEEDMMSTAASFSLSKKPRFVSPGKVKLQKVMLTSLVTLQPGHR